MKRSACAGRTWAWWAAKGHQAQALHRVDGKLSLDEVKIGSVGHAHPAALVTIQRRHKAVQAGERLAAGER